MCTYTCSSVLKVMNISSNNSLEHTQSWSDSLFTYGYFHLFPAKYCYNKFYKICLRMLKICIMTVNLSKKDTKNKQIAGFDCF